MEMTPVRSATVLVAAFRVAYATALVVAPARVTQAWIGPDGGRSATQVAIRGLAARDAIIHVGMAAAALRGAPVRPWLAAGVAGDLSDIAATFASRSAVPGDSPRKTALVAGASAAVSAGVAAYADC
jgi:hypothetical protein